MLSRHVSPAMSRSNQGLRHAARLAPYPGGIALDLALISGLAIAAAYCTWVWLAPRVAAAPAPGVESRAQEAPSAAARRLFASAAPQAERTTALRLIGVIAPKRAIFLVAENGRPRSAAVGESVGEIQLLEVHPDHVVVSRGDTREHLTLEQRAAGKLPPSARSNASR